MKLQFFHSCGKARAVSSTYYNPALSNKISISRSISVSIFVFLLSFFSLADMFAQAQGTASTTGKKAVSYVAIPAPDITQEAFNQLVAENTDSAVPASKLEDVRNQFDQIVIHAINNLDNYFAVPVDMNNLPSDVPTGGFPGYACPSPSMTKDAPFAITSEFFFIREDAQWQLRLYLWKLDDFSLLSTDFIITEYGNMQGFEANIPAELNFMFSKIKNAAAPPENIDEEKLAEEKWLYAGIRFGLSLRFYTRPDDQIFENNIVYHYYNISAATYINVEILSFLGVQAEVIFTTDNAPFKEVQNLAVNIDSDNDAISSYSLMFPLLVKFPLRKGSFYGAALAGGYFILPIGDMQNKTFGNGAWGVDIPFGITGGINAGIKLGPGAIFFDIRYAQDLSNSIKDTGEIMYKRSIISIGIGYEMGFITKNKKPDAKKAPSDAASTAASGSANSAPAK